MLTHIQQERLEPGHGHSRPLWAASWGSWVGWHTGLQSRQWRRLWKPRWPPIGSVSHETRAQESILTVSPSRLSWLIMIKRCDEYVLEDLDNHSDRKRRGKTTLEQSWHFSALSCMSGMFLAWAKVSLLTKILSSLGSLTSHWRKVSDY